ncbi:MAG: hypothetical protein M0R76_13605 [Proteobacteria bacterium]|jgi:hypothetical protein|nr:hypothetical protein [Pseudomonadota bacterium]NLN62901.1 hypothetical protein [Myxococcales bacterium]
MKSIVKILILLVALLLISCGGTRRTASPTEGIMKGVDEDYDPVTAILGKDVELDLDDDDTDEEVASYEAPLAPDEDLIGGDMGVFLPTVTLNGKEEKATYTVRTADHTATTVHADVTTGQELTLHPGLYDMEFTSKKVAGSVELRGVEIIRGRRLKRIVKFPVGEITLLTSERGCATAKIKIRRKDSGDWLPGNYSTCKPILLPAGEYVADKGGTEVTGIVVYDGGKRNIVIRAQ